MPFIIAYTKAGLPFTIANPVHIKYCASTLGQRAKTNKLDIPLIAYYSKAIKSTLS